MHRNPFVRVVIIVTVFVVGFFFGAFATEIFNFHPFDTFKSRVFSVVVGQVVSPAALAVEGLTVRESVVSPVALAVEGLTVRESAVSPVALAVEGLTVRESAVSPVALAVEGLTVRESAVSPVALAVEGLTVRESVVDQSGQATAPVV